jgi:FSR family fosmidomycin resistance protein-like MFS transporter
MAISETTQPGSGAPPSSSKARTSFGILGAISLSHLLNDMIQSLILAIYPLLQSEFSLTFMQIGMITLTFQLASSLLQPVVGYCHHADCGYGAILASAAGCRRADRSAASADAGYSR